MEEAKLQPVPLTVDGKIDYIIDWTVTPDPENPDKPTVGYNMKYNVNPEVMFVLAEITRGQILEVIEQDKKNKSEEKMTLGEKQSHYRTLRFMEKMLQRLGYVVYERHLEIRDREVKKAAGETPVIEIVSDKAVIDHIKKRK